MSAGRGPGRTRRGAPPPVGLADRLGSIRPALAPVLAHQHPDESLAPGVARGLLQFGRRVGPVDLPHDHQVARVDEDDLAAAQVGQVAAIQVRLQDVAGHLGHPLDPMQRPASALVGVDAEVVQAPVDGVWCALQVAGELDARDQPRSLAQIPVLQLAPGLH